MTTNDELLTVFDHPAALDERLAQALVNAPAEPSLEDLLLEGTLLLKTVQAPSLGSVLPVALRQKTEAVLIELLQTGALCAEPRTTITS